MDQDLEQKLRHIEDKLDAVRKDVRAMRIRMLIGAIINILVIFVPLAALIYFLPTLLNNFLSLYLPAELTGNNAANFQEQLRSILLDLFK